LTARTARRRGPPGRAFVFYAPLRVASKAKIKSFKGVLEKAGQGPLDFLSRHVHGDWGDLCEEDRRENQVSLERGFRLLSSYRTLADVKLYVITEADRSVTTILLPEEY
jgi:hypothetical protein